MRIRTISLFFVCLASWLTANPSYVYAGSGGICLTDALDLVGLSAQKCFEPQDIDYLMTIPVDLRRSSKLKMTSPQSMTTSVTVESCTDYFEHQRKGWYALSQRDMDRETVFVKTCGLLGALRNAVPARHSYMQARDGLGQLKALPAELLVPFLIGDSKTKAARSATMADLIARKQCALDETGPTVLRVTSGNVAASFHELARADFNGDGFLDILVSVGQKARGGTASGLSLMLLTRTQSTGIYQVMPMPAS